MARVSYLAAQSLDGYIAERDGSLDWLFQFGDPEKATGPEFKQFMDSVTAIVMGSATYEFLEGHEWPYESTPTWVFTSRSDRLAPDGADIRFVSGRPAEFIDDMRAAAGDDGLIWIVGGGKLADQFVDDGLLDEVLVTIVPVILGSGIPLFDKTRRLEPLELTRTSEYRHSGLVELRYRLR